MANELDELPEQDYSEEEYDNGFLRWMSVAVVIVAIAGFFALAWYAYHSSTQTAVSEEDVTLVQADTTPIKEAPADPGGLQFPHQDKTVYETIASGQSGGQGELKPAAERVLPPPEEPARMDAKSETETWVNGRNNNPSGAMSPGREELKIVESDDEAVSTGAPKVIRIDPQTGTATSEADRAKVVPVTGSVTESKPVEVPVATVKSDPVAAEPAPETPVNQSTAAKPAAKPVKTAAKPSVKETTKETVSTGATRVQLGAFRSEQEAAATWSKVAGGNASLVNGKSHSVQRADLGAKGVFYRLQLGGFADAAAAKRFCDALAAKKQGCFVVK